MKKWNKYNEDMFNTWTAFYMVSYKHNPPDVVRKWCTRMAQNTAAILNPAWRLRHRCVLQELPA